MRFHPELHKTREDLAGPVLMLGGLAIGLVFAGMPLTALAIAGCIWLINR